MTRFAAFHSDDDQDTGMILGFGDTADAAREDASREVDANGIEIDWARLQVLPCDESLDEGHPSAFRVRDGHVYDAR